ncbi:Stk1 family PASTA domain-containing Ser/Thr kinase [Microbacterium sp. JB110]|uniref:Stk1 family PASTA domain-containing Ser/Thr kinase n=1 Tax=Microbacterium sp. JB110 TaxID=2024477 RepID=UPI00097F67C1|nr:Stk1 family PASTA domain-containing Ser/Thr kinase [Microbacterium sp. JB110]RCS60775.1 Stk1 family PASTA domain-containing Ser/Thr kinase [Microbacterium sp. JB110]SJM43787.1 Serine/threonine protein kinase PrkC, regulator of stationary phase [Frigoribacterium sp. JB110]
MSPENRVLAGRYRVEDVIGEGGMATVHRGTDEKLGRAVAIKILKREHAGDKVFRHRFRMEAQSASRMAHPSIVRVYDTGEATERVGSRDVTTPFIVMEYVQGTLLSDLVARGPVPSGDAVAYVDGVLEALAYAHRAGVVHRDIKPANIMVTESGVKVMDFGISRAVSDNAATVAEAAAVLGTANYFSPEQAKSETVDARTDIYSVGVVLYELLTGRPPFEGESPVAVAYQHVSETPAVPSRLNSDSPGALDAVVLRALAKDPFQRFPDAATFREALDAATSGREPSKRAIGKLTDALYGANPRHAQETQRSLRQLSSDTTMVRTQSGPPVAWIWAAVAFIAVIVISMLIWVISLQPFSADPTNAVVVPELVEAQHEEAVEELSDLGLAVAAVTEQSREIEEGAVIRTDPVAGTSLRPGTRITVVVSGGHEVVAVPELVGTSQEAAQQELKDAGLKVGLVAPRNDPEAEKGRVLSASATAGDEVLIGSTINLVVATGEVAISDYTGFTVDSATRDLEALGLTVASAGDDSCAATDPATVVAQSIGAGDTKIASEINLRYCSGE